LCVNKQEYVVVWILDVHQMDKQLGQ